MAQIFDPKLAINFAAVVRNGSITAAARAMGLAQPWVSEQVRKLELQVGERLLERTSRHMALTEPGKRFLPLAEALAEANEAAQRFAADMRVRGDRLIRVGATDFTIGLEERLWLIDRVIAHSPRAEVEITGGKPGDLIAWLRAGQVDVALVHFSPAFDLDGLDALGLGPRYAHALVPCGDALADRDAVTLADLAKRRIMISPGRSDKPARSMALAPLEKLGTEFVPAPDENRQSIATFAARQRLICFWYYRERRERHAVGSQICIPIEGCPLRTEMAVVRRHGDTRGKIVRFWSAAEGLIAQLSAGNAPDAW
ncbi:LysR family transcriptional regulator [Sphingomonas bacterium]|uniref:LysR family transcriptional regulator n=1 Tax=Sphingomonas bacterium TaxID=1895847 RepID=UPI0015759EBB|nr:LysR family transcriptional regulator [Sphingomonas bacterium]